MQPGQTYLVVLNLAALRYDNYKPSIYSHETSEHFDDWLNGQSKKQVTLHVLAIPDDRFFERQEKDQRVRHLTINLAKIRKVQKEGFELDDSQSPFEYLAKNHGEAPFSFGTISFRIETKKRIVGNGSIAFSFWYDDTPVEELTYSACIVAKTDDQCSPVPAPNYSLKGIEATNRKGPPDAALHFVELESANLIGVFRCNTCRWEPFEYKTWKLGGDASWFHRQFDRTVLRGIRDAANGPPDSEDPSYNETMFQNAGDALYGLLFHSEDQDPMSSEAEAAFRTFVVDKTRNEQQRKVAPSLFVRLLSDQPDQSFVVPVGLARLQIPTMQNPFLGFHFRVETPLEFQDYSPSKTCISNWVLLVPPKGLADNPLGQARVMFDDWIDTFKKADTTVYDDVDLHRFKDWINPHESVIEESDAVLILSHHRDNSLFIDKDKSAIFATNVKRPFAKPSIAIIDACGTANPGAFEFVREFNSRGVYSVIASSVDVNARMAGTFLKIFADQLDQRTHDRNYTIDRAMFDSVKILSTTPDEEGDAGRTYGPRALIFELIGNGHLRLCVPHRVQ